MIRDSAHADSIDAPDHRRSEKGRLELRPVTFANPRVRGWGRRGIGGYLARYRGTAIQRAPLAALLARAARRHFRAPPAADGAIGRDDAKLTNANNDSQRGITKRAIARLPASADGGAVPARVRNLARWGTPERMAGATLQHQWSPWHDAPSTAPTNWERRPNAPNGLESPPPYSNSNGAPVVSLEDGCKSLCRLRVRPGDALVSEGPVN